MSDFNQEIKDKILLSALTDVPFDGWRWDVIQNAAVKCGLERDMAQAVFPDKIMDVLRHFSNWADRQMLDALVAVKPESLRVRDRIRMGVEKRLEVLVPYKESVRAASIYWLVPSRKVEAAKQIWKTADVIWNWAGDTAQDYNHYTKRGLLSGVIGATTMAWLNDKSPNHQDSLEFLDRRLDEVLKIGKFTGGILKPVLGILGNFKNRKDNSHA